MAKSGSISVTVTKWDTLIFSWETTSQSIANNTSNVSWKLELTAGSSGRINSSLDKDYEIIVNGTSYKGTNKIGISSNSTKTLVSGSTVIKHNADGSKTFSYSFTQEIDVTFSSQYIDSKSGSGTGTLDKIPRAATITAAPNFDDEDNPTITYSNPAGTAVESLKACISLTGAADDIAYRDISKSGTTYTFSLTTAERNVLRNATTTANNRTVRFYVQTVIGGETYRNFIEKTLTIVNAEPTLSPTAIDKGSVSTVLTGDASNKIIKGYNSIDVATNAAAKKGATIKSYKIECGGKSISTATGTLNNVENDTIVFTVTDSRGNTVTKSLKKTLINYVKLTCNLAVAAPTTDGDMDLSITGNYFNGSFGAVANTLTVQYRIKVDSGSYGSWTAATATLNGNKYTANLTVSGLDYRNTYTIQARALDKIYNADTEPAILSGAKTVKTTPVFDWGANDFAFNVPVAFNAGFSNSNKLLWEGSYYMTAGQTANLNDAVSNQSSGIVLVFSRYDIANSQPLNEHFCYCFVPKIIIQLQNDKGSVFNMATSNQSYSASKYLYISDTSIRGHDNNGTYGTGDSGVNYNNNRFVLRYVIGV